MDENASRVKASLNVFSNCDSLVIDLHTKKYTRIKESTREQSKELIKKLYGGRPEYVEITSSGMNAIQLAMMALIDYTKIDLSRNVLLFANELYTDTNISTVNYLEENGAIVVRFDQSNYAETKLIIDEYGDRIAGLFLESCSNPHGKSTDWKILKCLPPTCYTIVDNTWLSPVIFNPFHLDPPVDVVVESCTKYLSGSTVIMGHICGLNKKSYIVSRIQHYVRLFGVHISPIQCQILNDQLLTVKQRVMSSIDRTEQLLKLLDAIDSSSVKVFSAKRSSIILLEIEIHNEAMKQSNWRNYYSRLIETSGIPYETSYGKRYDAICQYPHKTSDQKSVELRLALGFDQSDTKLLFNKICEIIKNI